MPKPLKDVVRDSLALDESLAAPFRYSLIAKRGDAVVVHRLVQETARQLLSADEYKQYVILALVVIDNAFPAHGDHPSNWPACHALVTHANAIVAYSEGLNIRGWRIARLLNNLSVYFKCRGFYYLAQDGFARASRMLERSDIRVTSILNNLGNVCAEIGQYDKAAECFREVFSILDEIKDAPPENKCRSLNNLGRLYTTIGEYALARESLLEAHKIAESLGDAVLPELSAILSNLGGLELEASPAAPENIDAAMEYFSKSLEIEQRMAVRNPITLARRYNAIGGCYQRRENLNQAEGFYKAALDTLANQEIAHPDVAMYLSNLGSVAAARKNWLDAIPLYENALDMIRLFFSGDHPDVVKIKKNLMAVKRSRDEDTTWDVLS